MNGKRWGEGTTGEVGGGRARMILWCLKALMTQKPTAGPSSSLLKRAVASGESAAPTDDWSRMMSSYRVRERMIMRRPAYY